MTVSIDLRLSPADCTHSKHRGHCLKLHASPGAPRTHSPIHSQGASQPEDQRTTPSTGRHPAAAVEEELGRSEIENCSQIRSDRSPSDAPVSVRDRLRPLLDASQGPRGPGHSKGRIALSVWVARYLLDIRAASGSFLLQRRGSGLDTESYMLNDGRHPTIAS